MGTCPYYFANYIKKTPTLKGKKTHLHLKEVFAPSTLNMGPNRCLYYSKSSTYDSTISL